VRVVGEMHDIHDLCDGQHVFPASVTLPVRVIPVYQ